MKRNDHEFINCKGVFQGGGCKAIAFIGAYEEALKRGVCFTEFSGTSAGSIFAALIAAGASIEDLKAIVEHFDDETLIPKDERPKLNCKLELMLQVNKLFKVIPRRTCDYAMHTKIRRGKYDAKIIEDYLDERLRKIVGKKDTVRFTDLKFPLTIVAADIKTHSLKIYSSKRTKDMSVAHAVSCSCAVPFFFRPVEGRYLDGGLISNLPVSFFDEGTVEYSNILAFCLKSDEKKYNDPIQLNFSEYIEEIINTMIEGATSMQLQDIDSCTFSIPIRTTLDLLDFKALKDKKKIETEINAGRKAFENFIKGHKEKKEKEHASLSPQQYLTKVGHCSCDKNDKIVAVIDNYKLIFKLFLTIVKWKNRSKNVTIYLCNNTQLNSIGKKTQLNNSEFDYAKRLLINMGIELRFSNEKFPILGYFFYKNHRWKAVIVTPSEKNKDRQAHYYNSSLESKTLQVYIKYLEENFPAYPVKPVSSLAIKAMGEKEMIDKLYEIDQYKDGANIRYGQIKLSTLYFLSKSVYGVKYRATDELFQLYKDANLKLFSPAVFVLSGDKESIITPPVIEFHEGKPIVVSGLTRLFYAYKQGLADVGVIIVDNCKTKLPNSEPCPICDLRIVDIEPKSRRKDARETKYYRKFEHILRPSSSSLIDKN